MLGALVSRVISLKKASEIMEIEPELFLELLDLMGLEFSYSFSTGRRSRKNLVVFVKIVFNSSPLIFLACLEFLETFVDSATDFYLPIFVGDEISACNRSSQSTS